MATNVIEIKFSDNDLVEAADAGEHKVSKGDHLIVGGAEGERWAVAIDLPIPIELKPGPRKLPAVLRVADEKDMRKIENLREKSVEARKLCAEKVEKHNLPMKIISVDMAMDGSKITFHFTAENRVDFRELVKDLAGVFRTRIELHQVGVRDEARIFGGIGPCGCRLCCTTFVREFQPVSIKMAKEQNLPLNPMKISGLCGRLLCCLRYEYPTYNACKRGLPRPGQIIENKDGRFRVGHVNVLQRKVTLENEEGIRTEVVYPEPECGGKEKAGPDEADHKKENNDLVE